MSGDPNSPHPWLRPIKLTELKELRALMRWADINECYLSSSTFNRLEIALAELQERMEADE